MNLKQYVKLVLSCIQSHITGYDLNNLSRIEQYRLLNLNIRGKKIEKRKGMVLVKDDVPQFNFWVLNKVLGMIAIFDAIGQEYRIDIRAKEEGFDVIKSFLSISDSSEEKNYIKKYDLGDTTIISLDELEFDFNKYMSLLTKLYRKYFKLTPEFLDYVNEELKLIKDKKVLGVLMRGTDYSRKKPKGLPIQPSKEEVVEDAKKIIDQEKYKYVYLATDEYENEKYLREKLKGKAEIIINQRLYYDEFYKETDDLPYISSCRHDRENDRFLTSREYLSSIIILANCDYLLAGNCGGSRAAILLNDGKYKGVKRYDLGNY